MHHQLRLKHQDMPYTIEHSFVVDDWILHTSQCQELILYLISIQLHIHFAEHLTKFEGNNDDDNTGDNSRFVQVADLEIFIHDNVYKSIRFKAMSGTGYKLPSISHYGSDV